MKPDATINDVYPLLIGTFQMLKKAGVSARDAWHHPNVWAMTHGSDEDLRATARTAWEKAYTQHDNTHNSSSHQVKTAAINRIAALKILNGWE